MQIAATQSDQRAVRDPVRWIARAKRNETTGGQPSRVLGNQPLQGGGLRPIDTGRENNPGSEEDDGHDSDDEYSEGDED